MRAIMLAAGTPALQRAKANAPVASGRMQSKTKLRVRARSRTIGARVEVATDYAAVRMFASTIHARGATRSNPRDPYIVTAVEQTRDQAVTIIARGVQSIMDHVFNEGSAVVR
jgi:hypothetical protein